MTEVIQSYECVVIGTSDTSVRVRLIDLRDSDDHKMVEIPFSSLPFEERELSVGESFYWDVLDIKCSDGLNVSVYSIHQPRQMEDGPERSAARKLAMRQIEMMGLQDMHIH